MLFVALLNLPWPLYVLITLAVIAIGTVASSEAEQVLGKKDPGCIVIDEFAGYLVAMAFVPREPALIAAAFVLFRFFDILKPWPIKKLEKIKGGWGVMVDDLVAGLFTSAILQIWMLLI